MLAATLDQVHGERRRGDTRRRLGLGLAGSMLAGSALTGGFLVTQPVVEQASATSDHGVRMTVSFQSLPGWIRLEAEVDGVSWGENCQLVVTDGKGKSYRAGSWMATEPGLRLSGAVSVPLDEVRTVAVLTEDGRDMVRVWR